MAIVRLNLSRRPGESNGIELYRDKPVTVWDIREDGRIIGVTEEPVQAIYELGKES